jgi:hypothetical protein
MNNDPAPLGAERLERLFDELSDEFSVRGEQAHLFVVGGAAMALAYDDSRLTHDVDAVFEPRFVIRPLIEKIADRNGLDRDWLNDAAKGFLPGDDTAARTVYETDHVLVQVASPEYLLAMKLHSGRAERDIDDAVKLWGIAGYTRAEQGHALVQARYPASQLLPRHRYIVEDVAARAAQVARDAAIAEHRGRGVSEEEIETWLRVGAASRVVLGPADGPAVASTPEQRPTPGVANQYGQGRDLG